MKITALLPLAAFAFTLPPAHAQWVVNGNYYSLLNGSAMIGGGDFGSATSYTQTGGAVTGGSVILGYVVGGTSNSGTSVNYNLLAGTFTTTDLTLSLDATSYYGSGYFNQSGGTATVAGTLRLGYGPNTGRYTLDGGTLSAGMLNLAGTSSNLAAVFFLNGGTLVTSNVTTGGPGRGNNGLLLLNGGTLQADPNTASPGTGWINASTTAFVSVGGAVFDTAGTDRTIEATLARDIYLGSGQADGGLIKKGAGTLTLSHNTNKFNNYTGATTLQAGTLSIGSGTALGNATNAINFDGGTLQIKRQAGQTAGGMHDFGFHTLNTATFDGGLDIADADNIFILSQSLSGTGRLDKLGAGTLVLSAASTRSGATTVAAGTLVLSDSLALQASSVTVSGTGVLDFGTLTSATLGNLNAANFSLQNTSAAPLALTLGGGDTTATSATAFSGPGSLAKTGTGTITLTGANTYTGGTTISAGTLRFAASSSLAPGSLTVASGATAAFNVGGTGEFTSSAIVGVAGLSFQTGSRLGLDTTNADGGNFTLSENLGGDFTLVKLGSGLLTLGGVNTHTGGTTLGVNTGTVSISGISALGTGPLTFDGGRLQITGTAMTNFGSLSLNTSTFRGSLLIADSTHSFTLGHSLSGSGYLSNSGPGTLVLTGTNTFTGGLYLNTGLVEFSTVANLGNGLVYLQGGGLRWAPGNTTDITASPRLNRTIHAAGTKFDTNGNNVAFSNELDGAGGVTKSGAGTLTLNAVNTYTGGTTVNGGTLAVARGGQVGAIRGALTINAGATVVTSAVNALGWGAGTKVDTLTINQGTLDHTAAGSHGLGIAYTLNGATLTSNGGVSSATAASHFAVDGASSFNVTGSTTSTIAGRLDLRGDGNFDNVNFTVQGGSRLNVTAGISSHSGSTLVGPVGFTKLGAGTMSLTGDNIYSGNTLVSAGTLLANNTAGSATGSGNVTVQSAATLGGSGRIGGLTTLASGAHLAPGNSPGTITFTGGLTLNTGSILDFELGTASDLIRVSGGTLTGPGSGKLTVNLFNSGGFTAGTYTLIDATGATLTSIGATSFELGTVIAGYDFSFTQTGNLLQITATAVPEPATFSTLAGVLTLSFAVLRRRRSSRFTPTPVALP
ncbi:MAG TPA: autotransporter-associated beta strand repeat-containing protein [Rariglobus sp.]|nr:autotransporter-associated beta strand repeat-containing protein [Rariglobus sp.]